MDITSHMPPLKPQGHAPPTQDGKYHDDAFLVQSNWADRTSGAAKFQQIVLSPPIAFHVQCVIELECQQIERYIG